MNEVDKKEIVSLMGEALEQVVLPRFDNIENRLDKIEADLTDVKLSVHRIELRQSAEVRRVDNHEVRISRLETARKK